MMTSLATTGAERVVATVNTYGLIFVVGVVKNFIVTKIVLDRNGLSLFISETLPITSRDGLKQNQRHLSEHDNPASEPTPKNGLAQCPPHSHQPNISVESPPLLIKITISKLFAIC